jgi:hypothetical protein
MYVIKIFLRCSKRELTSPEQAGRSTIKFIYYFYALRKGVFQKIEKSWNGGWERKWNYAALWHELMHSVMLEINSTNQLPWYWIWMKWQQAVVLCVKWINMAFVVVMSEKFNGRINLYSVEAINSLHYNLIWKMRKQFWENFNRFWNWLNFI